MTRGYSSARSPGCVLNRELGKLHHNWRHIVPSSRSCAIKIWKLSQKAKEFSWGIKYCSMCAVFSCIDALRRTLCGSFLSIISLTLNSVLWLTATIFWSKCPVHCVQTVCYSVPVRAQKQRLKLIAFELASEGKTPLWAVWKLHFTRCTNGWTGFSPCIENLAANSNANSFNDSCEASWQANSEDQFRAALMHRHLYCPQSFCKHPFWFARSCA